MISILCLNPAIDTTIRVPALTGRECVARSVEYSLGGKAVNVARWLAANRVSHRLAVFGDPLDRVLPNLAHTEFIESGSPIRQNFTLCDDADLIAHIRTPVSTSLSNIRPTVIRFLELAAGSKFAVLAGSVPRLLDDPDLVALCNLLSTSEAPWILDTASFSYDQLQRLNVHTLKVNGSEFRAMAGLAMARAIETTEAQQLARKLKSNVIITQGAGDVIAADAGGMCERYPIPEQHRAPTESFIGSGDSFLAGYLCGVDRGQEFEKSVQLGTAFGIYAQHAEHRYVSLNEENLCPVINDIVSAM